MSRCSELLKQCPCCQDGASFRASSQRSCGQVPAIVNMNYRHCVVDACFQVDFSSIFSFHWVIYIYILYSSLFHSLHHIIPSLRVQICACTHANLRECTSSSSCCTQAHVLIWHRPGCSRRVKEHLSTGGGFHHALWRQIPSLHDASELLDLQII